MKRRIIFILFIVLLCACIVSVQFSLSEKIQYNGNRIEIAGYTDINFLDKKTEGVYSITQEDNLIVITEKSAEFNTFTFQIIKDILNEKNIEYTDIHDHSYTKKIATQYVDFDIFMLKISMMIICVHFTVSYTGKCIQQIKSWIDSLYKREILKKYTVNLLEMIFIECIALCIILYCIVGIKNFMLFIPYYYIPPKYIFDMGYYTNLFSMDLNIISSFDTEYIIFNKISIILTIILSILLIMLIYISVKKEKTDGRNKV